LLIDFFGRGDRDIEVLLGRSLFDFFDWGDRDVFGGEAIGA